jgi:radical SAM protein with 4Fe4S-binding SPASM domain
MTAPVVSCVIPVLNGERYLGATIESVLGQTYGAVEVIVADDGSTDATPDVARAYGSPVRYLHQANAGHAAARNLGLAAATGAFVAFLDADDLWHADKLARQMGGFQVQPALDISVTHVRNFWSPDAPPPDGGIDPRVTEAVPGYRAITLLARRRVFETVGRFDPALRHGNDTAWFLRAAEHGVRMELLPEVLVFRRLHDGNRSRRLAEASQREYLRILKASLDRRRRAAPAAPRPYEFPTSSVGAAASPAARAQPIPLFERLQVESQAHCNRACWFCPRTFDRSGKYLDETGRPVRGQMPTETILDILDQARGLGFQGEVGFHHYSEPLLDGRNVMLAREARRRGLHPYLHTNGDMLRHDDRLCRDIVEVYGRVVVGLYDYATDEERTEAERYWRGRLAGAARLEFSSIGVGGIRSGQSIAIPRALVPTDPRMAVPDLTFGNAPCHRPLLRMVIQHDGEMANCCEDTRGAFGLGNVHRSSLEELWHSPRHVAIVTDLVAGRRDRYALCRQCPLPPTGPAPGGRRIAVRPRRYVGERPVPVHPA